MDWIEAIAARLGLREPNKEAIESLAVELHRYMQDHEPPFEGVIDAATGVGKTYLVAAAIEYFAAAGQRNVAVITRVARS